MIHHRTNAHKTPNWKAVAKNVFRACFRFALLTMMSITLANSAMAQDLTCWFTPGSDGAKSKAITDALSKESGLTISPRVAANYPEIFTAFTEKKDALVYAGSFAATMLNARGLAVPLTQKIDGKELYAGVLIHPQGSNPVAILTDSPADISYAIGASSGESSAKAATGGKAAIGVKDHMAAVNAVKAGKAKGAVVKDYWWEANKDKFPEYQAYEIPGVSVKKNPDNILMASASLPTDTRDKIIKAAMASQGAFGATRIDTLDASKLNFSQELMTKGGINPQTYTW